MGPTHRWISEALKPGSRLYVTVQVVLPPEVLQLLTVTLPASAPLPVSHCPAPAHRSSVSEAASGVLQPQRWLSSGWHQKLASRKQRLVPEVARP